MKNWPHFCPAQWVHYVSDCFSSIRTSNGFLTNKRLKMETMSETKLYNASRSTNLVLVISSYDFVSIV